MPSSMFTFRPGSLPPIPLFSQVTQNGGQSSTASKRHLSQNQSEGASAPKTPRMDNTRNNNNNSSKKVTNKNNNNRRHRTSDQRGLLNFDSQNPDAVNTIIPQEAPWKRAGPRTKKPSKAQQYLSSVGTNTSSTLKVVEKPFSVYIGRLDNGIVESELTSFLKTIFKKPIGNLNPIVHHHKWFKSFWFTVSYLEKDKIFNKELWPSGCVINSYMRPRQTQATSATTSVPTLEPSTLGNAATDTESMTHEQAHISPNSSNSSNPQT